MGMLPKYLFALLTTCAIATSAHASGATETVIQGVPDGRQFVPAFDPHAGPSLADDRLALFAPSNEPVRHRIDFEVWDFALKNMVLSMGPSTRQGAPRAASIEGTRLKHGPQSRYRLEGSMVLFRFFDDAVISSFTEYRQDLERVSDTLDIAALPRDEQLAFWFNLHNVALMEQIAKEWPVRTPSEITLGGEPLDDAKFITLRGIPVSLRDIRENIVFRHWRDPKVMYGFWRGEIGGPHLQPHAFTGANVSSLLNVAAADFVNSLRGTQKRGSRLEVARLYAEVAPFYFPEFERDVRAHLSEYAEAPVAELLTQTNQTSATISEPDIADLHGGARPPNYLFVSSAPGAMDDPLIGCSEELGQAACNLVQERTAKLQRMLRRGQPTGRVFFSNNDLPGDPPNKNAVE
jgi:hypothetical protein